MRWTAVYVVLMSGMAYAGLPIIQDVGASHCCSHDDDCEQFGSGFVGCEPTSPAGCSEDDYYRCIAGCQDQIGNYYCPGAGQCDPI
jgi:hypothetical protein